MILISNYLSMTLTLKVFRDMQDDIEWINFAIIDTGMGIPEDSINKLFLEFLQVYNSSTRKFGGTGLGLTISRRFCLMMGGDIRVKSVLNEALPSPFICPSKLLRNPHYVVGKVIDSCISSKHPLRFCYCQ
jgi:signal transduction histidine kinase